MKHELEKLQQRIQTLQEAHFANHGQSGADTYIYTDHLTFIEHKGRYDITWFGGDRGYNTSSTDDLPPFDANAEHLPTSVEEVYYEGNGLSWLIDVLVRHPDAVASLTFTGDDVGANGLRDWDFDRLVSYGVAFPHLHTLKVQLHVPGNHNHVGIGIGDDPQGERERITKLISLCPEVAYLELPSVPSDGFFHLTLPRLSYLRIQAGYDGDHFIKRLASSPLLRQLTSLDFADVVFDRELSYRAPHIREAEDQIRKDNAFIRQSDDPVAARKAVERRRMKDAGYSDAEIQFDLDEPNREEGIRLLQQIAEDEEEFREALAHYDDMGLWDEEGNYVSEHFDIEPYDPGPTREQRTTVEDYKALFSSDFLPERFHFILRECYLTMDELMDIQRTNPQVSFLHVPTQESYYVSHRIEDLER